MQFVLVSLIDSTVRILVFGLCSEKVLVVLGGGGEVTAAREGYSNLIVKI